MMENISKETSSAFGRHRLPEVEGGEIIESTQNQNRIHNGSSGVMTGSKTMNKIKSTERYDLIIRNDDPPEQAITRNKRAAETHDLRPARKALCYDCGEYHNNTTCVSPICEQCNRNHLPEVSCLNAQIQLQVRADHQEHEEKRRDNKKPRKHRKHNAKAQRETPADYINGGQQFLGINAFGSATLHDAQHANRLMDVTNVQSKETRPDGFCRSCGNCHGSVCNTPLCAECNLKHWSEIPCAAALTRLQKRIVEHDQDIQRNNLATISQSAPSTRTNPFEDSIKTQTQMAPPTSRPEQSMFPQKHGQVSHFGALSAADFSSSPTRHTGEQQDQERLYTSNNGKHAGDRSTQSKGGSDAVASGSTTNMPKFQAFFPPQAQSARQTQPHPFAHNKYFSALFQPHLPLSRPQSVTQPARDLAFDASLQAKVDRFVAPYVHRAMENAMRSFGTNYLSPNHQPTIQSQPADGGHGNVSFGDRGVQHPMDSSYRGHTTADQATSSTTQLSTTNPGGNGAAFPAPSPGTPFAPVTAHQSVGMPKDLGPSPFAAFAKSPFATSIESPFATSPFVTSKQPPFTASTNSSFGMSTKDSNTHGFHNIFNR